MIVEYSVAQVFQNEDCGHSGNSLSIFGGASKSYSSLELDNYLDSIGYKSDSMQVYYNVPVKFWVFRRNDSRGGPADREIKYMINYLNYYYSRNNTGIRFYLNPEIEYFDRSKLNIMNYIAQVPVQTMIRHTKGNVNVLVVRRLIRKRIFRKPVEYNGTYNTLTQCVVIGSSTSSSSLSHEVGHFFGLHHPHKNWKKGKRKQEAVDRNRRFKRPFNHKLICEENGDKLCDTPAEPDLNIYTDNDCNYTNPENIKDNWGDSYMPDTKNIMSYTRNRECRDKFTPQQIALMLKTAENKKHSDYWKSGAKETENFAYDQFEPDFSKDAATNIFFNTPQVHTFHKVHVGNRNNFVSDNEDWMIFELKVARAKDITLKISKTDLEIPRMEFQIFSSRELLKQEIIEPSQTHTIKLPELLFGKYYIKLLNLDDNKNISGYMIEVINM